MNIKQLFSLGAALVLAACGGPSRSGQTVQGEAYPLEYARGLSIERAEGYTRVNIRNPWDTTAMLQTYVLVPAGEPLPDTLPEGTLLRTPLQRVVAFSSVHCGMLDFLDADETLVGICESRYVNIPGIQERLQQGLIADVGDAGAPNIERIIELAPEALITTPLEGMSYGRVEKIGIPLIETTDYMELTPLGRAEWIRFYGLLFGKERLADSLFACTAEAYNTLKAKVAEAGKRPRMLSETKTGSAWYIPGGRSYAANLYRDAGADYPWSDNAQSGSVPLSFEHVLERAADADVWVFKYNRPQDMTYADLENEYGGYTRFAPLRNRNVYGCNTHTATYYEDVPIHPDWVLADLVWIFHPELMPDYTPRYFRKLQE